VAGVRYAALSGSAIPARTAASAAWVREGNSRHERTLSVTRSRDTFAMAKLIFSAITSLDGYIEDEAGNFDWAAPDDEVHSFINDLERPIGTYLYGRRMYETMVYWETADVLRDQSPVAWDWMQLWRAADKVVYSRSLETASSARSRIERDFDPSAIRAMKNSLERDISIGGPELAAQAFRAGLVDQCQLFLTPVLVGGGKPALPTKVRLDLDLVTERRFDSGVVFLDYRVR
jgi:dihydrofolate reductase